MASLPVLIEFRFLDGIRTAVASDDQRPLHRGIRERRRSTHWKDTILYTRATMSVLESECALTKSSNGPQLKRPYRNQLFASRDISGLFRIRND